MDLKSRLKEARLKKGLSQNDLAKLVEVHVTNISRYERGENKPATNVLIKLANVLDTTSDFLMNGSTSDIASNDITDKELLSLFKQVNQLATDRKKLVKEFLSAFVLKTELQQKLG